MAIALFDEQRIALGVEDVETVADELQGLLVRDANIARMSERLNGLAMTAVEDLLDGGDTSAIGPGMGGNFPELFEGSGRVLASGLGKFDVDLVAGALRSTGSSLSSAFSPHDFGGYLILQCIALDFVQHRAFYEQ